MYIPGINYSRKVHGTAQTDISRFGKLAALESGGAIDAAATQGKILTNEVIARGYALNVSQTNAGVALAQKQFAESEKWAAFTAIGNLGVTLLNDVITPIYNQTYENQKAASDRVYKEQMDALSHSISNDPIRQEEGPEGVMRDVSNSDRLQEAYAKGHEAAREQASKEITLPKLREFQNNSWDNNGVENVGILRDMGYKWDKELAADQWGAEYASLSSMDSEENFRLRVESLEGAKRNRTIGAETYAVELGKLNKDAEMFEVQTQITAISGTDDPIEFMRMANELEAKLVDTQQLTKIGGAGTNQLIGQLNTVKNRRITESNNQRTALKALNVELDEQAQMLLMSDRIVLETAFTDMAFTDELASINNQLKVTQATIMQRFGGTDQYNKEQIKVADSLIERYGAMTDLLINRQGGAGPGDIENWRALVLASPPSAWGFGEVQKSYQYKDEMLAMIDTKTKHHKELIIANGELEIVRVQTERMDNRTYSGPQGSKFISESLGYKSEKTEAEFLNDYYSSQLEVLSERADEGEDPVALMRELDDKLIHNVGADVPSLLVDDIKAGLAHANPQVAIAQADRLASIRTMLDSRGSRAGGTLATEIYGGLTDQQKAVVDFYDTTPIQNGKMSEDQLADFKASIAYTETSPAQIKLDRQLATRKYSSDENIATLLESTMEKMGYDKDAMAKIETRPDYENLRNMTQLNVEKYAGLYSPDIAAHKAARETLRFAGVTDRTINPSLPGNLESYMNDGLPVPGMADDHAQWQAEMGITEAFADGELNEQVRIARHSNGVPVVDRHGKQLVEAWYFNQFGDRAEDASGNALVYRPIEDEFDFNVKIAKEATREGNKLMMEQGQRALAFIYEEYPYMEDDFWNPSGRDYTGMPFDEMTPQALLDFNLSRAQDILPSAWWRDMDEEQITARKLSHKETHYIKTQIGSKFDLYLTDNPDLSVAKTADLLTMRMQAENAAVWNAAHNTKRYPGYTPDGFEKLYPDIVVPEIPTMLFGR